jgi:SAM-dependent methyltransferase
MLKSAIQRLALACPTCSAAGGVPVSLSLCAEIEVEGDVISGHFECPECPRRFPILDGVAVLDPEPLRTTYDRPDFLQAYLWTHYSDLSPTPLDEGGPDRGDYFERLAAAPARGFALDLGCNVGRTTFDLSTKAEFVLGVERSFEAVKRAREIARTKRVAFHLKDEGDRGRYVDLDASGVVRENVEFICGDAAALPLGPGVADTLLAANLVDRMADPLLFLERAHRTVSDGGQLILTAPFTWKTASTPREKWLGDAKSSGREVLLDWLEDHALLVEENSELTLTIRNHRRFYELLRPILLRASKTSV